MAETDAPDHETRVRNAFDSLDQKVGTRLDEAGRRTLDGLRTAAQSRDTDKLRAGLTGVQESHGWLYQELAEHPSVANLLNELALWGF